MNYCKPVALNSVTCDLVGETKLFLLLEAFLPWVPEVFLACGGNFRAGHYKDLTETGNRARKVSGTQGKAFLAYLLNS